MLPYTPALVGLWSELSNDKFRVRSGELVRASGRQLANGLDSGAHSYQRLGERALRISFSAHLSASHRAIAIIATIKHAMISPAPVFRSIVRINLSV
jgi:hypothetical protein